VAEGTPEQVAREPKSFTGAYLSETLKKAPVSSDPVKVPKPSRRRRVAADEPDLLAAK